MAPTAPRRPLDQGDGGGGLPREVRSRSSVGFAQWSSPEAAAAGMASSSAESEFAASPPPVRALIACLMSLTAAVFSASLTLPVWAPPAPAPLKAKLGGAVGAVSSKGADPTGAVPAALPPPPIEPALPADIAWIAWITDMSCVAMVWSAVCRSFCGLMPPS